MVRARLYSPRLDLCALDAADLEAWLTGDAAALHRRTGARFPASLEAPPVFSDDLPALHDTLLRDRRRAQWAWLLVLRATEEPVGMAAIATLTGEAGVAALGYSLYAHCRGNGYMTEALQRLLDWLRMRGGVVRLRATIPPTNSASLRVAQAVGMTIRGSGRDEVAGDVLVCEIELRRATSE